MKNLITIFALTLIAFSSEAQTHNIYIVQEGDVLSEICEKFAKNGGYEIYMSHAERLGIENPDILHAGEMLTFPILYRMGIQFTASGDTLYDEWITNGEKLKVLVDFYNRKDEGFADYFIEEK